MWRERGNRFFSACCLQLLANCRLTSRTWHCLCVFEREPPPTTADNAEHQCGDCVALRWHQNLKCVGLGCTPGCHFSLPQCAEAKKGISQGSLILSISETRQMNPLNRREHVVPSGLSAPNPLCRCFWRALPSCGGRCGKNTETAVWYSVKMLSEFWGRCCQNKSSCQNRPDWRLVVKDVDGEDKKCVWCRRGEERLRFPQKSGVVEMITQESNRVCLGRGETRSQKKSWCGRATENRRDWICDSAEKG